jgi:hypothetical protein
MEKDGLREREEWMSETYGCFLLHEHIPQHDARTATQRAIAAVNVIQMAFPQFTVTAPRVASLILVRRMATVMTSMRKTIVVNATAKMESPKVRREAIRTVPLLPRQRMKRDVTNVRKAKQVAMGCRTKAAVVVLEIVSSIFLTTPRVFATVPSKVYPRRIGEQ